MVSMYNFFKGDSEREVAIHPQEWDVEFVKRFRYFLEEHYGARFSKTEVIGPVGSQEFTWMPLTVGDNQLRLQAETYMGISIIGPAEIVDEIVTHYTGK